MKNPQISERLIVAFDMETVQEALVSWSEISTDVTWVKLGYHLLSDIDIGILVDTIKAQDGRILADLKSLRTTDAIKQHMRLMEQLGVDAISVHYSTESLAMAKAFGGASSLFTPLLLTSMGRADIERDTGVPVEALVVDRAKIVVREQRFTGIVTSGQELKIIREELGDNFVAIVPGIRDELLKTVNADDQKRTVGLEEAFQEGADYVIVGRPIFLSGDPKSQVEAIQERIKTVFNQDK